MKRFILGLAFFAVLQSAHAQISDPAYFAVKYKFTHIDDTTQPENPWVENMVLYLGKNFSSYQSYDKVIRDSILQSQVEAQTKMGSTNFTLNAGMTGPITRSIIYHDLQKQKLVRLENLFNNYLITGPVPEINWSIQPETKNIQGLDCQKATATFRGRDYTAWFCSQLPYSNGPWKLGGLPGLIIDAYDDKKEVIFQFMGFEDVSQKNVLVKSPEKITNATEAEYAQLYDTYKKDPQGFMKTQMAGASGAMGSITVSGVRFAGAPSSVKRKVVNNPIEKSDK